MTIMAGLFAGSFGRILGPRKGTVAAVVGISIYTVLVGVNAAVVRLAIMGGVIHLCPQVGLRQHGLNTLAAHWQYVIGTRPDEISMTPLTRHTAAVPA